MSTTMRAVITTGHGGADRLSVVVDAPVPTPGEGEVRVRVTAAAVNNTDIWSRQGRYGTADDPALYDPDTVDGIPTWIMGSEFGTLVASLKPAGRLVVCGAIAGPLVELDLRSLYLEQRRIIGSTMHTPAHFRLLADAARSGTVKPVVAATFPLADIAAAQEMFMAKGFAGKIVREI